MNSKIKMLVHVGWWKVNLGGFKFAASYLDEYFPVTFLQAIKAWKDGNPFSLEFNGETIGHVLFVRPIRENRGHLILSKFDDYDGGFCLPIDAERANLTIGQGFAPGEFKVSYESNLESPELPQGLWIHQEEINIEEFVSTLIAKIQRLIKRAGGVESFIIKEWLCSDLWLKKRTKRSARKIERKVLWKVGYKRPDDDPLSMFKNLGEELDIL